VGTKGEIWQVFKEAFWAFSPRHYPGRNLRRDLHPHGSGGGRVFYGIVVGLFIYRNLTFTCLYEILRDSAVSTSVVMIVVALCRAFCLDRIDPGDHGPCGQGLLNFSQNPIIILLAPHFMLLVAGMLMDAISIFYVFLPIFIPS